MDNAIYIALSKQAMQFRKLEVHANNMANAETPSFKQNVMMATEWKAKNGDGKKISFTQDLRLYRNTEEGALKRTGNALDVAISGPGYFVIQNAGGNRYTRAGNFQLNPLGQLVTHEGKPVLNNDNQPMIIPPEAKEIEILKDGTVRVDGLENGRLNIVQFANEQSLERESATLYKPTSNVAPTPVGNESSVQQGMLEGSNVQPIVELTELITTQRGAASTSNFMDTAYDLQRRATTAWAKQGN
jgi:flagellar basal-body rod protein FlgF